MKKNESVFIKDEIAKDGKRVNTKIVYVRGIRSENCKDEKLNVFLGEMEDITNKLDKTNERRKERDVFGITACITSACLVFIYFLCCLSEIIG